MAVAAYASLVSLTHGLHNVHYRVERHRLLADIKQIEAVQGRLNFLLEFLELHSNSKGERIERLWRQISEVAVEVEEVFDLHVVSQLQLEHQGGGSDLDFLSLCKDVARVIEKMDFNKHELLAIDEMLENLPISGKPKVFATGGSSATSSGGKNTIVGFDEHAIKIMDQLTSDEPNLQILPIVGMGGIGKTTLAKKVFDDPCIVRHFDLCIWLTISQEYSVDEILKGLLNDGVIKKAQGGNLDGLGKELYQKLFGRRYLIVMDDVWTEQAWNDLSMFFPDNLNRSWVMITTRLSDVANSLGCHNLYPMTFLDENKSWDLFCQTIFAQKECPNPELEKIGKKIVKSCKGLPLAIIVIGGLLAKSDMRKEYWKLVAENVSSFANSSDDEHCLKILRLSYDHLPIHLKPCFLYMKIFREDSYIEVSKLTKSWVEEGYIKRKGDKYLEDIAMEYMKDLIDRNLIFIRELIDDWQIEACGIHDLLRDLCISEFDKEHFMRLLTVEHRFDDSRLGLCWVCNGQVAENDETCIGANAVISLSISEDDIGPVCGGCQIRYSHTNQLRWVRILDCDDCGGREHVHHTKIRHLNIFHGCNPFVCYPMIQFMWNLQSLTIEYGNLPCEIWEMPQLRCIHVPSHIRLPDPPIAHSEKEDFFILKNLYSLGEVRNFNCTDEVLNRIPNLKELQVYFEKDTDTALFANEVLNKISNCTNEVLNRISNWKELEAYFDEDIAFCNLNRFQKLESLDVCGKMGISLEISPLPLSLKKLSLQNCKFTWSGVMSIIGPLPNLETLKLFNATEGSVWNLVEGEFRQLKILTIEYTDLVQWTADESHFPNLELLHLSFLPSLEEIPLGIGDIPTLHTIRLVDCSESTLNSAWEIWKDQQNMGNETLQILVFHFPKWISISDVMSLKDDKDEDDDNGDDHDKNDNEDRDGNNVNNDGEDEDNDDKDEDDDNGDNHDNNDNEDGDGNNVKRRRQR